MTGDKSGTIFTTPMAGPFKEQSTAPPFCPIIIAIIVLSVILAVGGGVSVN